MQMPYLSEFEQVFHEWLVTSPPIRQSRFLLEHPELLSEEGETLLRQRIAKSAGDRETEKWLQDKLDILQDAQTRENTGAGILDAYVNVLGGFILEMPFPLEAVIRKITEGRSSKTTSSRLALLRFAIPLARSLSKVAPETLAELLIEFGSALDQDQSTPDEQMLQAYEVAKKFLPLDGNRLYASRILASLAEEFAPLEKDPANARSHQIERTIAALEEALLTYTFKRYPRKWAAIQVHLGPAYLRRTFGDKADNIEQAIACLEAGLASEVDLLRRAAIHYMIANAYQMRINGSKIENLQRSTTHYKANSQAFNRNDFPAAYFNAQLNIGVNEANCGNWAAAHEAYEAAYSVESAFLKQARDINERDRVYKMGHDSAVHHGYALIRLGKLDEAAVVIERGRARDLSAALQITAAEPWSLSGAERYSDFSKEAIDPAAILRASEYCGSAHALVYLVATPWGGVALASLSANPDLGRDACFAKLDLPDLTSDFMRDLDETVLEEALNMFEEREGVIGGFAWAQEGNGFIRISVEWPGVTFEERALALHHACQSVNMMGTLDAAAQEVLEIPLLKSLVSVPLDKLSDMDKNLLAGTLNHSFLRRELQRCSRELARVAMIPLVGWLIEKKVVSLSLIPCDEISAFPLTAIPLVDGRTVSETIPTSILPNARVLLLRASPDVISKRNGFFAVGDPRPTHQELRWSEAEVLTLARLAEEVKIPSEAHVHFEATRTRLIEAFSYAYVVDASCHGQLRLPDFLQTSLMLAENEELTLEDLLALKIDLRGLRLFMLSACQTAIFDRRGARDEVRSLATSLIQAGVAAVLGTLWAVDDRATYLLITRFAQEWFPHMNSEPPARALARAQQWIRTVTNGVLQKWQAVIPKPTVEACHIAGSASPQDIKSMLDKQGLFPFKKGDLVTVRGRGKRYLWTEAEHLVQTTALRKAPDVCPYADPYFWAGFQIIGW